MLYLFLSVLIREMNNYYFIYIKQLNHKMNNQDNEIEKIEKSINVFFFVCFLSMTLNFIVIFFMRYHTSVYSSLLKKIAFYENMYIFSKVSLILMNYIHYNQNIIIFVYSKLPDFLKKLTFNYIQISYQNFEGIYYSCFISTKSIAMTLSIFLCSEVNSILRNPFSRIKTRKIKYYIITATIGFITLLGAFLIKFHNFTEYELYLDTLIIIIYCFYIIFGFFSLFHLTIRFCFNKSRALSLTKFFVIRHFFSVCIYCVILSYEIFNDNNNSFFNNIFLLSTGSIMFFIRIFDIFCTVQNAQGIKASIFYFFN